MMKLPRLTKRQLVFCFGCLAFAALLGSCSQDPIFMMIAREVRPREPRIKGVPTKMVVHTDGYLYVGGTSLHRYANKVWDAGNVPQPPGRIMDLAAANNSLYALVNADSPELYRLNGGSWDKVNFSHKDYPRLQAIYGETDSTGSTSSGLLFVGASKTNFGNPDTADYAVFYTDGSTLNWVVGGTGLLTGAAVNGSGHYFSTKAGVYYNSSTPPGPFTHIYTADVTGLIQTTGQILALCFNGDILNVTTTGAAKLNTNSTGFNLRGPATIYDHGSTKLLLVAVETKDSLNRTYGYREIIIPSGGLVYGEIPFREPGTAPSSMDDSNRYKDTIESKPLNDIFQVPSSVDPNSPPLFASVQGTGTAKDNTDGGLWSYRSRDGIMQWNAEE